jgi:hypothetical protein
VPRVPFDDSGPTGARTSAIAQTIAERCTNDTIDLLVHKFLVHKSSDQFIYADTRVNKYSCPR